jgi:hypothetical protein
MDRDLYRDPKNRSERISVPVAHEEPQVSLESDQWTVETVTWAEADGSSFTGVFKPGTAYQATVTLKAKTGWTFVGVEANSFFEHEKASRVIHAAGSGTDITVTVLFPVLPIMFNGVTAGCLVSSSTVTTMELKLTFDAAINGLTENDITLDPSLTKEDLTDNGSGSYTLLVSGITVDSEVKVSVSKKGYSISGNQQEVTVYGPQAQGGKLTFIKESNVCYEVHTFTTVGSSNTLSFNRTLAGGTVEVLVVAGGGGGGKGDHNSSTNYTWHAGGGGAGGYIYASSYPVDTDPITVQVGAGGTGATSIGSTAGMNATTGGTGGDSVFGNIIAKGGGGGASHTGGIFNAGQAGGSGGGGTYTASGGSATLGTAPDDTVQLGYAGGGPTADYSGCGGGGAGGVGGNPGTYVTNSGALGGIGFPSSISGEKKWYAGGGAGGAAVTVPEGSDPPPEAYGATGGNGGDANTGDGGSGSSGGGVEINGGKGGSGIVIVRWPYEP